MILIMVDPRHSWEWNVFIIISGYVLHVLDVHTFAIFDHCRLSWRSHGKPRNLTWQCAPNFTTPRCFWATSFLDLRPFIHSVRYSSSFHSLLFSFILYSSLRFSTLLFPSLLFCSQLENGHRKSLTAADTAAAASGLSTDLMLASLHVVGITCQSCSLRPKKGGCQIHMAGPLGCQWRHQPDWNNTRMIISIAHNWQWWL